MNTPSCFCVSFLTSWNNFNFSIEPNPTPKKFGYELHGKNKNYLKVEKDAAVAEASTFPIEGTATVMVWFYALNVNEKQYIMCK